MLAKILVSLNCKAPCFCSFILPSVVAIAWMSLSDIFLVGISEETFSTHRFGRRQFTSVLSRWLLFEDEILATSVQPPPHNKVEQK